MRSFDRNRPGSARLAPQPRRVRAAGLIVVLDYVDDERAMYAEALRAAGFIVETFDDPIRALERVNAVVPGAVVTRIMQPGSTIDGLEFARRLKADDRTQAVPLIVVTSRIEPEFRSRGSEAGCDAYLLLPCLPDRLIAVVERLLSASGSAF